VKFGATNFFASEKAVENLTLNVAGEGDGVRNAHQLEVNTSPLLWMHAEPMPRAVANAEEEKPDANVESARSTRNVDCANESEILAEPVEDVMPLPLEMHSELPLEAIAKAKGTIYEEDAEPTRSTQNSERVTESSISAVTDAGTTTLAKDSSVTAQTLGDLLSVEVPSTATVDLCAPLTDQVKVSPVHEDCTCSSIAEAKYSSRDIPFTFAWLSARREPPCDLDSKLTSDIFR
jgi:hypothetical protein